VRPLILVSNDDGIDSPHLKAVANAFESDVGQVLVIAPERQRSAVSHTITLHKPLRVKEHAPRRVTASGTPVDCVYLGLVKLAPRPPALVFSGINDGYNLGNDVFYSGTVAGAVEGGLRGVPAIAMSLAPFADGDQEVAVAIAVKLARALIEKPPPNGIVLNVNVPAGSAGRFAWTRLGRRIYQDDVHERSDPRGRPYYWIGGGEAGIDDSVGTDVDAVYRRKVASITPLQLDLTAHNLIESAAKRWPLPGLETEL
jgi:5'-nucleotidase